MLGLVLRQVKISDIRRGIGTNVLKLFYLVYSFLCRVLLLELDFSFDIGSIFQVASSFYIVITTTPLFYFTFLSLPDPISTIYRILYHCP